MPDFVLTGRHPVDFIERGIERLSVGKTYHGTDIFHIEVLVSLIDKESHRFVNTILVDERCVIHVKSHIHHSGDVPGVGAQFLCKLFSGVVLILVLLLDEDDVEDFLLEIIHKLWTDETAICGLLLLFFCNVVFCHIYKK